MIVYRISNALYSNDISGTGAKLNGSRWNTKGTPMLYTTEHISLALLEMLVHTNFKDFSIELDLVSLELPEDIHMQEIKLGRLKKNWVEDEDYTKFMGDEFIKANDSLLLKVPSVIIHEEYNYLANPLHPEFKKIKIKNITSFRTDKRLFAI